MKNLNSLLMRLSALSLAAIAMFAVATAATARKDDKAASAAVMGALVEQKVAADRGSKALHQTPQVTPPVMAPADVFDRSVRIGSATNPQHLCVYDYVRAAGDVTSGAISQDPMQAGLKHIIGITKLDPRTQQFQIIFKDKSKCSHGAFVDLDFVTTVTLVKKKECAPCVPAGCQPCLPCKPKGKNECQSATNVVRVHNIYCHPCMTPGQISRSIFDMIDAMPDSSSSAAPFLDEDNVFNNDYVDSDGYNWSWMKKRSSSALFNAKDIYTSKGIDLRLTPFVRVENLTKNVNFGFIPYDDGNYPIFTDPSLSASISDQSGSGFGFYEDCWGQLGTEYNAYTDGPMNSSEYPEWSEGTLAYTIKSDCVAKVGVVNEVADSLDLPDLFELFSEDQLAQLCGMLEDHFTNQEDMCRYIATNRFALSRAFKALD